MSTNTTLAYNNFFHLYHDAFNDQDVSIDFLFSDCRMKSITISMPAKDALVIYSGLHSYVNSIMEKAYKHEDDIRNMVTAQVNKRVEKKGVYAQMGAMIYGGIEDPIDTQISRGVEFYSGLKKSNLAIIEEATKDIDDGDLCEIIFKEKDAEIDLSNEFHNCLSVMKKLITLNKVELLDECLSDLMDISKNTHKTNNGNTLSLINEAFVSVSNKVHKHLDNNTPNLFDVGEV